MNSKPARVRNTPVYISDNKGKELVSLPVMENNFDEKWLQNLIQLHPNLIPASEIERNFAPLIPIGKEFSVESGAIDNLFISPNGYITIVETKLWRNPEARRSAVSQIIEYAKDLHKWNFIRLDNQVVNFNKKYSNNSDGIINTIRKNTEEEIDEKYLVDIISRNLRTGRILLVIAGDGIRESVEEMADYLNQYPQLFYTLALVELKVYKLDPNNESLIVIPQVVMRTKEILRTVIKIETGDIGNVAVTVSTDIGNDGNESSMGKRYTISEDEYFHQLEQNTNDKTVSVAKKILHECAQKKFEIEWGQGSFSPKLILPDVNGYISLFIVDRKGRIYLGFSRDQFEKLKLDPAISNDYAKRTAALMNTEVGLKNPHSWTNYQLLVDLLPVFPEFMLEVDRYVKNINSAIESKSIVPEKH